MYDKEMHERAAERAMKLMRTRSPLKMGANPVYVNNRCTEISLEALEPFCPYIRRNEWNWLNDITIGLGAGFSGMGEVCGGVTGAIIVFGIDISNTFRDTSVLRLLIGEYTQRFIRDFRTQFGSVRCIDLLGQHSLEGYLMPGDKTYQTFIDSGIWKNCPPAMQFSIMYPLPSEYGLDRLLDEMYERIGAKEE
ncbi:MAG: C-GCAxxG-C-C family protein [Syntrophales bacterium]|jgi:C_GCAxxG_C_C family probable redox protein|nr:C-GCAxxG-C-C family protein [Syntrophales bacterium]MDY0045280.1 C-GCAxxG-C-C family protein [Syntrophales bacterium]